MSTYKSNSHRSKEEAENKKVEKVVKGAVKTKKKSSSTRFKDVFIAEEASSVKDYILMDVLLPTIKKAISDIVSNGVDMLLYGETGRSSSRRSGSKVSYSKYYDERDRGRERDYRRIKSAYDYEDIFLETRAEAEEVLNRMDDLIDNYGIVSVADLYDLVGISSNYTDNKYGWTNLRNARVERARDGYYLNLPKALPID